MDLKEAINKRRSIRQFKKTPVEKEVIEKLLESAYWAPSLLNSQPWKFTICTGNKRDELASILKSCTIYLDDILKSPHFNESSKEMAIKFFDNLGDAPTAIVVTSPKTQDEFFKRNYLISAGHAIQNFWLSAHEAGIGVCCVTASYWIQDRILKFINEEDSELVIILIIGYPDEIPKTPPRKNKAKWL